MAEKKKKDPFISIVRGRLSYPSLHEAKAFEDGKKAKYSAVIIVPANYDLTETKKTVYRAKAKAYGDDKSKWPKLRSPFNDGNDKADKVGYKNTIWFSASDERKPQLRDKSKQAVDPADIEAMFYPGCYCNFVIRAYKYGGGAGKGKKVSPGVGFGLVGVQFVADGKRFGNVVDVDEYFEEVEDEAEDEENYEDGEESEEDEDTDDDNF